MAYKFKYYLLFNYGLQALTLAIGLPVLAALDISDVSKLRSSQATSLSQCSLQNLTSVEQRQMFQCYMGCLSDSCCKAVDITSCEQSYVSTEALDFVKEVRVLGSLNCLGIADLSDSCSCPILHIPLILVKAE